jgi:predicted ribosomally synthesized peptide with nif11-like leader
MSRENAEKFYELLKNDPAIVEELKTSVGRGKEENMDEAIARVVRFAAEKGFEFTGEELAQFELENQELTPDELENINAAGAGGACFMIGWGWNDAFGAGITKCSIVGIGIGVTWKDSNDPDNKFAAAVTQKIVSGAVSIGGAVTSKP